MHWPGSKRELQDAVDDMKKDPRRTTAAARGLPFMMIMAIAVGAVAGLGKSGTATLLVDGRPARTLAFRMSLDETLDCGKDTSMPVNDDYNVPFHFTGTIAKVAVRVGDATLTPEEQRAFDEIRGRGVMAE